MEARHRSAIIKMARAGNSPAAIVKALGYPKSTVYDVYKRWKDVPLLE